MKTSFYKYQLKYWVPVYAWLILIFYFSSQSLIPSSTYLATTFYLKPYLQHVIIYTILALLIYRALSHTHEPSKLLVIFTTTLYGLIDEIHQYYIPGRTFELFDILMDFSGAILALILIWIFRNKSGR